MIWIFSFLLAAAEALPNLKKVSACDAPKDAARVMLIKQWHLAPTNITKSFKEKYPQERNQTAIYNSLNDAIKKKKVQIVVGEGCEGEINSEFKGSFNGWDYASLKGLALTRNYPRIVTHVPLKLEARHGDKLMTICGDNEAQIKEGNLRLSNLRGWVGFWTRLQEPAADAERLKLYSDAAAELLKVSKDTPLPTIQSKIKDSIRQELALFTKSLNERNGAFVKSLEGREFKTAAIVIGGLHAQDLKAKLQTAGYACDVYEPLGYRPADENLIQEFEKILSTP